MTSGAEVARRRARVLALRTAGLSPTEIAEREATETGQPARTAKAVAADIAAALKDRKNLDGNQRDMLVAMEVERLDSLQRATETLLRAARNDQEKSLALRAVDRLLRISERRSALLGLDTKGGAEQAPPPSEIDEIKKRRDRKMKELGLG